jgi:hypothetical protein
MMERLKGLEFSVSTASHYVSSTSKRGCRSCMDADID